MRLGAAPGQQSLGRLSLLAVGLYAWVVSVLFGMVLLDIAVARSVAETAPPGVGDLLLLVSVVSMVTGIGAVAASWDSPAVRTLLIGSLAIGALEVLALPVLAPIIQDVPPGLGTSLRLAIHGLSCVLAFLAFGRLLRSFAGSPGQGGRT